jgi:Flp pilus assembly secretin CpaC
MTALCVRSLAARPLYWLAVALFAATAASRAVADEPVVSATPTRVIADDRTTAVEPIVVHLDEARILKLPDRATTVVIGNPLIADLSIQPGGLAVVTGKSFGATNVIVMDKSGAVLTEQVFEVQGPVDQTVVVYRGISRETYSCTPICSARLTLGDDTAWFNTLMNEITTRNTQSLSAGSGGGH